MNQASKKYMHKQKTISECDMTKINDYRDKKYFFFTILIAALFLLSVSNIIAQEKEENSYSFVTDVSGVGTSAAPFLEIDAGARSSSLGGAYTSVANDVSALYWNPAGIVWNPGLQIEFSHSPWLADISYNFFGITQSLPSINSSIGFSLINLDYGEQTVRTVDRPEGTGETYGASDMSLALTFAMALTDRFSFGITGKYIAQKIYSAEGSAFAIDVGVYYSTMLKGLRLGASVSNFGSQIQLSGRHLTTIVDPDPTVDNFDRVPVSYKTGQYDLPLLFRAGISYQRDFGNFGEFLLSMDLNHPSHATESISLGFEYGFAKTFYIRSGYKNLFERDSIVGLSFGAGIDYQIQHSLGIRFDYSWTDWGVLKSAQRFSVALIF